MYDLPLIDVYQAYFEETIESMDFEALEAEKLLQLETAEERQAREASTVNEAEDAEAFAREVEAKEQARLAKMAGQPGAESLLIPDKIGTTAPAEEVPIIRMTFLPETDLEQDALG